MSIHVDKNPNQFFVIIPSGKPQSQKPYQGQKGDGNCFLYSAKIATSIQNVNLDENSKRNLSFHRKNISALDSNEWSKRATILNTVLVIARHFKLQDTRLTKEWIHNITPDLLETITTFQLMKKQKNEKVFEDLREMAENFLKDFQKSEFADVFVYEQHIKTEERVQNHIQFFLAEGMDIDVLADAKIKEYEELKIKVPSKYHLFYEVFNDHVAALFGLKYHAGWSPQSGIDDLICLLKDPLVAPALLSSCSSENPPVRSKETMDHYDIYSWPAGTYKEKTNCSAHFIVVVGARKDPQEVIYFIDPNDKSLCGEKRKIYKVSYQMFCKKVIGRRGLIAKDKTSTHSYKQEYLLCTAKRDSIK